MPAVPFRDNLPSAFTALGTATGVVAVALNGSGSYDIVVRHGWATAVWWTIGLCALLGLSVRARPSFWGWGVLVALALLISWTAVSMAWTPSAELTLAEVARATAYLSVVVVVVTLPRTADWRAVVAGAALGAVAVCLWAMTHRLWPDHFDGSVSIFAGDFRRLSAPFGYWNAVGAWAGMTTVLCLGWSAHARRPAWRAAANAAVPLAISVGYLTYSRAAVGGAALGLAVLLVLSRNRATLLFNALGAMAGAAAIILTVRQHPAIAEATGRAGADQVIAALAVSAIVAAAAAWLSKRLRTDSWRMSRRVTQVAAPIAAVLVIGAGAGATAAFGPDLWDQFTTTSKQEAADDPAQRLTDLNGARYDHYRVALEEFRAAPWQGSGAGTFEYTWNQRADYAFVRDAHSLYVESLAELGIPGLVALLLLLAALVGTTWTAIRQLEVRDERGILAASSAAVTAYFAGAGVDWLWESPALAVLAFVLAGSLVLAAARPAGPPRLAARVAIGVLCLMLALVPLPALVSTSEIRKSQQAINAGNVPAARGHADDAIAAQPWAGSPWVQRALVDERAGAYEASAAELRRAAVRQPQDWRTYILLARVEARRGNVNASLAALRRAKELRPNSQFFETK